MEQYIHRVVLVSDMHYTTQNTQEEMSRETPWVRVSPAAGDALGFTQQEKVACVLEDIRKENPDAVIILGDLSIDDYDYRKLPENYCRKFKEDCMDKWSFPSYAIPGNHDSYPDELWREVFGNSRQFSVKIGNAAFILLDTFRDLPAKGASGGAFTPVDIEFLKRELEKYPTEKIFLCAHYFPEKGMEDLTQILDEHDRIVCLFRGHTHINETLRCEAYGDRYLIDIGGYGYQGECVDGKWLFDRFDPSWAWGYQVVEWNDTTLHTYHVKPERCYKGRNGVFSYPGAIEDELVINLGS